MKDSVNELLFTTLPRQGKRAVFLLTLAALPVLLLFLGTSEFLSVESDWAAGVRLMQNNETVLAVWQPENWNSLIFCRIITWLSKILSINEWLVRLPSVIAALALVSGTVLLALEIFDRKNGFFAGWLMIGSYGFLYWGRMGSNAMTAAALTVWSATLFYGRHRRTSSPFHSSFNFSILFALTLLLCGITPAVGVVFLLLPQWWDMAGKKQFSWHGSFRAVLAAAAAMLFCVSALCVAIYSGNTDLSFNDVIKRCGDLIVLIFLSAWREFITPSGSGYPESLFHIFRLMLPWTLFVPAAAVGLWKNRHKLSGDLKRLLVGMLLYLCIIGIFPERRWNALLPLLGPVLIILAAGLSARYRDIQWEYKSELIVRGVFIIIAALAVSLICTWPLWDELLCVDPPLMLLTVVPVAGVAVLAILTFGIVPGTQAEKIMKRSSPLAGTVLAGVILSILVNCIVFPQMNQFRTERRFWLESADKLAQCEPLPEIVLFYRCSIPENGIYYLEPEQPVMKADNPEDAERILRKCGGTVVLFSRRNAAYAAELQKIAQRCRRRFDAETPLHTERDAIAFVNSDARDREKLWGVWMLGL